MTACVTEAIHGPETREAVDSVRRDGMNQELINCSHSLVPRPHPLTRRIGLVKFLGLAHTFVTV